MKKKITYFLKNYVASIFTFFIKVFAICNYFTTWCLDVRFRDLLFFICLKFNPQYWYLLLRRGRCVDLVVIFNKGREETFIVSLQDCKSCVCIKYLTLVRPRKLIPWTLRFYTRYKIYRTKVLLKNYSFHNFLNRSDFVFVCLFSKNFSRQKMLTSNSSLLHGAYFNSSSNAFAYLLIIFLGKNLFGFFLNKWRWI